MSQKLRREINLIQRALNPESGYGWREKSAEIQRLLKEYEKLPPEEKERQNTETLRAYAVGEINGEPVSTDTLINHLIKVSREER
jgi:hypothetical protein